MSHNMELIRNEYYWLEDSEESYVAGKLLNPQPTQNNDYQFELYSNSQIVWKNISQINSLIPSPGESTLRTLYDDLTDAIDISEASVLWNLRQRYQLHNIYSAIGPIVIAINPYCKLPDLYSQEKLDYYLNTSRTENVSTHIWGIARAAYLQLKEKFVRQAIVISGESGAGKTETTKKCLQYLSAASMGNNKATSTGQTAIEDRVLGSNPLLESFGNSKTCRNNNSSRFGKWLEINFNCGKGKFNLIGANITQYLLEKSRVVTQAEDERNYHIFYQMCSDESMGLGLPENYVYLNQSGCTIIEGVDDYQDFQETKKAFNDLHFPAEDQQVIFDALKAILYLGNLIFEEGQSTSGSCSVLSEDTYHCLRSAATLLGFDENELIQALTTRTIQARGETMIKPLSIEQAQDTKNAFVKEIYGRLFSYIVSHANKSLAFSTNNELNAENANRARSGRRRLSMQGGVILSIGLLDIFGFEIFTSNSFEQLCINYGNEKLQQYFINYVLKKEQETYEAEGITVDRVETVDNQDVLHLLESKPFGVFAILDEEIKLPQGSDSGFIRKVEKEYKEKSSRFKRDFRMQNEQFEIHHFAGKVLYSATNFLDKNKDKLYDHLEALLLSSNINRFKEMMIQAGPDILPSTTSHPDKKSGAKHQRQLDTLASRFTGQLHQLINVLQESEPHFVRCIKPNNEKNPITFDADLVLRQLRYSGVLEAIQIRKSGYPTRKSLNDFFKSYRLLAGIPLHELNNMSSDSERCGALLTSLGKKKQIYQDMKLGKTMVFYRPDVHNSLERDKLDVGMRAILCLQSCCRRKKAMERVQVLWEARRNLRTTISSGYENQSSNINVIPDLEYWLYYCHQVGLYSYDIIEGQNLLNRLQSVKVCLEQLQYLLEHGSITYQHDITLEFTALKDAIEQAQYLNIIHPICHQIISRRNEIESRAIAVLALREAVQYLDEIVLETCLENIEILVQTYGEFCELEKNNASHLLKRLKLELSILNEVFRLITNSQNELTNGIEIELSDTQNSKGLINNILNNSLLNILQVISPLSPENNYQRPLSTIPSENIFLIIELIIKIRSNWISNDWVKIVYYVIEITQIGNNIYPHTGTSSSTETTCPIKSDAVQNLILLYQRIVDNEIKLVGQGIDVNVVLPMLNNGIINGQITINSEDISVISVDVLPLRHAIEKVQKIQTLGNKAKSLLYLVEIILSLRIAVLDDNYEMILALTEPSPITSCRHMRQMKLFNQLQGIFRSNKLHKQSSIGFHINDLIIIQEENTTGKKEEESPPSPSPSPSHEKPLSNFPMTDLSLLNDEQRLFDAILLEKIKLLSGPFLTCIPIIQEEIKKARLHACDRYTQVIMLSALEIPRIIHESNGSSQLLLNPELTNVIRSAITEVHELWKIEIQESIINTTSSSTSSSSSSDDNISILKRLGSLNQILYRISEIIIQARTFLQEEKYDKILEMNLKYEFEFIFTTRMNEKKWSSSILNKIKEELLITIAEAKNFHAKQTLLHAMKVGGVTGLIGKINIAEINTDHLTTALIHANNCIQDDPRPITTLRTLVEIAKDLVEVRRAFQILGPEEQLQTFRKLQQHGSNIPEELREEMKCIGCEVDFRESMTLLEKGLNPPPPVKYFIPSTYSRENRRQSQVSIRSSMLIPSSSSTAIDSSSSSSASSSLLIDEEEDLIPNPVILSSTLLQEGLNIAERLQNNHDSTSSLSSYLITLINTSKLILKLRNSVLNEDWKYGETILKEIELLNILETLPCLKLELLEANQVIKNMLLISLCENSLQSNQSLPSSVDIGFLDLSNTSLTSLNEIIKLCEETNTSNKSKRVEILYQSLLLIKDLRRSVLTGDWNSIKFILKQIKQYGIDQIVAYKRSSSTSSGGSTTSGGGVTSTSSLLPLCNIEIESVRIAAINQEAIKLLKQALLDEIIQGLPGAINIDNIETYKLTSSLGHVISIPVHDRGEFLSNFYNLSDLILKGRKSIQSQQWNTLRNLSTIWYEKLLQIKKKSYEIYEELSSSTYGIQNTSSGSGATSGGGPTSVDVNLQFPLKDYEYLYNLLIEERDLLQNHVTMIQLEGEVSKALLENGVSSDMVGHIDLSKIRIDNLQIVLERKDNLLLATNSTLPIPVEKLCKAAHLMLDIRSCILKGYWDKVPNLLEEALTGPYHPLPQACQQEINVIRLECENRWIINSLTTALQSNCLNGTVDDYKDTSIVSIEHLQNAIQACYTLTPRTDEAINLLKIAEDILKVRNLLITNEPNWSDIKELVTNILQQEYYLHTSTSNSNTSHTTTSIGINELQLIWIIADNILLCRMMEDELIKNAISGKPGNLDLSKVDTNGLITVCKIALDTSIKSKKTNQLLFACRSVLALRDALLRAANNPEIASDALKTVKSIVYSMYEVHTKNSRDAGWLLCRNEIALVTQDAHIQEVTRMLQESVIHACRIYASRNAASIGSLPGTTRRSSINSTHETSPLSCDSLDAVISYVEQIDFSNNVLNRLLNCAKSLKAIRSAVIKSEWELVNTLAVDDQIINSIHQIQFAIPELNYARQDAHNRITANKLENVLNQPMTDDMFTSSATSATSSSTTDHSYLASVIEEAEASEITAMSTQQLLECAKNVYLLRMGLTLHDNKQVAQALRWFGVNAYRCPISVQDEAKKAYIMHQNSLLLTGLTSALQTGYATGELGDMNITTVDTTVLSKLLAQAHDVAYQTPEVRDIVDIAEMIYCLRCAQRAKDSDGISKALDMLSTWGKMLPSVVVEEVAFARSERDNSLTIKILESTFSTFDVTNSSSLEMSLKSGIGDAYLLKFPDDNPPPSPSHSSSTSTTKENNKKAVPVMGRRYSYASMNRADIDLDTIDVQTLDIALNEAKKTGMYTNLAKSLYKTVSILRSLRAAMKINDWPKVEEILNDLENYKVTSTTSTSSNNEITIHPAAEKELQVIKNQLDMRTSIVDLSKALKSGWARCSNGIVDIDTLQVETLIDAISRAERSMQDLGISNDMKKIQLRSSISNQQHPPITTSGKTDISISLSIKDEQQKLINVPTPIAASSPSIKRYRKHFPNSSSSAGGGGGGVDATTTSSSSLSTNLRKKIHHTSLEKTESPSTSTTTPANEGIGTKSKLQEQVEKLLLSAGIVTEVRKALQDGNIHLAGELSVEALQIPELHSSVHEELTHYATEIGRALHMMKLCSELRSGIIAGNGEHIEKILQEAREATIELSSDLGLIRTMEKAQSVLKSINKLKKELNTMSNVYSIQSIEEVLESAKKLNITGYLIDNAHSRLSILKQFETGLQDLNINTGGIVTGRQAQQMIYDLGVSLGIKNHPICRRAAVLLKLNDASLSRVLLAEAIATGNAYSAATETIKLKRAFLRLPEVQEEYLLEKYPNLRSTSDFSMRLALESSELKHSMLRHTDGLIGTSLTILSPILAAFSVIIFTHIIKVLEENSSQYPEVLLRNLIYIGRCCPILRDEIFIQCLKQLRDNPLEELELRIWIILKSCLKYFTPSNIFENYLECFLLNYIKNKPDIRTIYAAACIRNMHESIFLYGYNSKIFIPWDSSLNSVKLLFQPIIPTSESSSHVTSGGSTSTSTTALTSSLLSSSQQQQLGRNSRSQQILYSFLDPAFVTMNNVPDISTGTTNTGNNPSLLPPSTSSTSSTSNTSAPSTILINELKYLSNITIRGTRDNWIYRFNLLSNDEIDISMGEFCERLFLSTSRIDRYDRIVLLYWICKYLPSKNIALNILRELSSDQYLYYTIDKKEKILSIERQKLIRTLPNSIEKSLRLDTQELKLNAIKNFWINIVCYCVSYDVYSQNIQLPSTTTSSTTTHTSSTGTTTITNNKFKDGNTSMKNFSSRHPPTSTSVKERLGNEKKNTSMTTTASPSSSSSPAVSSSLLSSSSSSSYLLNSKDKDMTPTSTISIHDLPPVAITDAYLTWPIYRDLILVGMERLALEYEQLQDKSNTNDQFFTKNKYSYQSSSPSPSHHRHEFKKSLSNTSIPSSPPSPSTSPSPVINRQRRNASHNKLPL